MGLDFNKKICIVTGSTTGIGLGIAKVLLDRGAEVYISGLDDEYYYSVQKELEPYSGRTHYDIMDFSDREATEEYIAAIGRRGPIDYVFANAGTGMYGGFEKLSWEVWDEILNLDLFGVIACAKAAVPVMLEQGHGHFIATSSIAGFAPCPFQVPYNVAKFGVNGLIQTLHYEYATRNIKFSAICPGNTASSLFVRHGLPNPANAMPLEECVRDIFEGLDRGDVIIPTGEVSKRFYRNMSEDPEFNDAHMRRLAGERI